jgi:hypothetical protein
MNQSAVLRAALEALSTVAGRIEIEGRAATVYLPPLPETPSPGFVLWVRSLSPVNGELRGEVVRSVSPADGGPPEEFLTRPPSMMAVEACIAPLGDSYLAMTEAVGNLLRELGDSGKLSLSGLSWVGADEASFLPQLLPPDDRFAVEAREMAGPGGALALRLSFEIGIDSALRRGVSRVAERKIGMERLPKQAAEKIESGEIHVGKESSNA